MKSDEIREKFIKFFKEKGHQKLQPASLIPKEEDQSVLFTSAGMQQFKVWYIDPKKAENSRVVTVQPCLRTSDIDEVGDETHHTFFEMLGNFSFGYPDKENSYFKAEAIKLAWEFLTEKKWLGIEQDKISASIFEGDEEVPKDEESKKILEKIGVKDIREFDRKENFWGPVGKTGPCGPTVEFFVPGEKEPIEIWNLVFNQYNRIESGKLEELSAQGVDTGMGFERLVAYLQETEDDYQTGLFQPIIKKIEEVSGKEYQDNQKAFRIIADHLKASLKLAEAKVEPSNLGQGYILRRLVRRAVRYGRTIGIEQDLVKQITPVFESTDEEVSTIQEEEKDFEKTLRKGLNMFNKKEYNEITGEDLFELYSTYGFPLELSLEVAKEKKIPLASSAEKKFNKKLEEHKEISRAGASKFKSGVADREDQTIKLHTATHLLHGALRQVLGEEVQQAGQNINQERLRFDFSHPKALTKEQIAEVENLVNQQIEKGIEISSKETTVDEAIKEGAVALFKDKYPDKVTLYSIGDFSKELCLGPHVGNTSKLGKFKITKEESSSKGVRRIRAVLK